MLHRHPLVLSNLSFLSIINAVATLLRLIAPLDMRLFTAIPCSKISHRIKGSTAFNSIFNKPGHKKNLYLIPATVLNDFVAFSLRPTCSNTTYVNIKKEGEKIKYQVP